MNIKYEFLASDHAYYYSFENDYIIIWYFTSYLYYIDIRQSYYLTKTSHFVVINSYFYLMVKYNLDNTPTAYQQ